MICKIYNHTVCMYLIIYYNTFFINFLGQQHLTILRLRVGGGGPGVLVGGGLSGLQPTEPYPHDLDRPPVSTAQYGIVQYSTSSPYLNCTIRYTLRFGSKICIPTPNPLLFLSRARFSKRSSSQLHEVERGTAGGGERGTLPSGPLNIEEREATACSQELERGTTGGGERGALPGGPLDISEEVATASQQKDDPANHAPLGTEEKVQ